MWISSTFSVVLTQRENGSLPRTGQIEAQSREVRVIQSARVRFSPSYPSNARCFGIGVDSGGGVHPGMEFAR